MSWTPEREEKLRELWKIGHSASRIASMLGDTTRNAVIGKAHRLNLEARATSKRSSHKTNTENTENNVKTEAKIQKLGRRGKFKALLLDPNFPEENPTTLENLTDLNCRWPLGEKLIPAKFFCGRKPVDKFPYCELHLLYGYVSKNEKEEDAIGDEDIPKFIEKKIKSA